jgi:D-alanyl-D-alanine carboxypeptidase (penicillin-binding protein 5/6)
MKNFNLKKNRLTAIILIIAAMAFAFSVSPIPDGFAQASVYASEESADKPPVKVSAPKNAKAVIVVSADEGEVFASKSSGKALPAASTSKLMTLWLVHEKIEAGEGKWKDKVKITDKKLEKMSLSYEFGGRLKLYKGKTFTVKQLYQAALIESNNAAATQLGRWVSGSDKKFAKAMNETAEQLGMKNSKFFNASGIDNADLKKNFKMKISGKKGDTNKMSARGAATLAQAIISTYPSILDTSKLASKKINKTKIYSTNMILRDEKLKKKAADLKVNGLKTGYTVRAGSCLIATCKPKGSKRIITVVLNDSTKFPDTVSLMKRVYKKNKSQLKE